MKNLIKLLALILSIAMVIPAFTGCDILFGGGIDDPGETETTDTTDKEDSKLYLDNYYVNNRTPIAKKGGMEVYKYENEDSNIFTLGGHDYRGGIRFWNKTGPIEYADIEFPLDGQYKSFSFVLSGNGTQKLAERVVDGKDRYFTNLYALDGAYPTLNGTARELKVGIQIIIDGKVKEEFVLSSYDVAKRYTYDVSGAETFELKVVTGDDGFNMYMMEITAWEGEAHETGYVPEPAPSTPVKLVRDLKPYLIPAGSPVEYYPNYASDERDYINMSTVKFVDAIATQVSMALIGVEEEGLFFDLEGKYKSLTFTAGPADRSNNADEGSAWLTVYADGKIILEHLFSTHDLYKRFTLDVSGCRQLKFGWQSDEGNEIMNESTGGVFGISDAYVATTESALANIAYSTREFPNRPTKMISELGVFGVLSNTDEAVFDGSSSFTTFSMGGVKYNEGLLFYSTNSLLMKKPAYASFNLGGKYDTISFLAGHISNSDVYKDDTIEIYTDGVLLKTITVDCTMLPQEYIIDVKGCHHLEFIVGKSTNSSMYRPAIGVVNLIAYPDAYQETELFPERKPADYGQSCDLIEKFGFYDVHSGGRMDSDVGGVDVEDGYYDGSTQKNYFTVGDRRIYSGVLLRTSVHLSFDTDMADAMFAFNIIGFTILSLAAAGEAHESAFALANISDSGYTSVTFTVAMQEERKSILVSDETVLRVGADEECVWETTLSKDMEPTTFTVPLGEDCERLLFFLNCGADDDASHVYAIYDIKLNK